MKIRYKNKKLEKIYSDLSALIREIGPHYTKTVKRRLRELEASENFAKYLKVDAGKPHPLDYDLKGSYGVSISDNVRLIVKPVLEEMEPDEIAKCKEVEIGGIVDYHGRKNNWILK